MATFRITGGTLSGTVMSSNGVPGYPDNTLPGIEGPVDPGYGIGIERPDQGLPVPPPSVWPPPVPAHPIVPAPPGTPPGVIWPSPNPPRPDQGLPSGGAHPDQGLPGSQPHPDQGLPPTGMDPHPSHPIASGTYWMLVYTPGFGWKYVTVDPSLRPDQGPPAPQPIPTPVG